MTWTGYYRGFLRLLRTGLDVYIAYVVSGLISNTAKLQYWYIGPVAAVTAMIFKILREKHPDSWFWKYLPV